MQDTPAISVILPCHNLAGLIGEAIASLRAQSFTAFEALVIDDGSTDGTHEAARRAIAGDGRFRLIASPHRGLSRARNLGLDLARGATVAFLDGDDHYAPGFLAAHHRELTRSGAAWTASALTLFWPDGRAVPHSGLHGAPEPLGPPRWLPLTDACDVAALFPSAWNKLYRRDLIGATRFREGALYEDHPFFWDLACRARRIRYLPQPLYHYRQGRAGQITARADAGMVQHLDRLREVAQIVRASPLTRQRAGLSRLATRAVDERCRAAPTPLQRAGFLHAAAELFAEQGWHWDRAGAQDIAPAPAPHLDPDMRLSVVLTGQASAAARTRRALADQTLPIAEILDCDTPDLRARLDAAYGARSPWVALLRAGDAPSAHWAAQTLETARRTRAKLVVVASGPDHGLALPSGLVACDPAMLVFRRDALRDLCTQTDRLCHLPDPLATALLAHRLCPEGAGLAALPEPLLTLAPRPVLSLHRLARSLASTPFAPAARAAIFAHLAQARLMATPARLARYRIALGAGLARLAGGLTPPPATSSLGRSLRLTLWQRPAH